LLNVFILCMMSLLEGYRLFYRSAVSLVFLVVCDCETVTVTVNGLVKLVKHNMTCCYKLSLHLYG